MPRPTFEDLEHPGYSEDTEQIRVFFDTEFTDLRPEAKLIAIGLITEDGTRTFYVELSDTYRLADVGDFAREAVLPLLEGGAALMAMHELSLKLGNWIEDFGQPVILATDSLAWDWPWIQRIFEIPEAWPANLVRCPLLLTMNYLHDFDKFGPAVEQAFTGGLRRHHALDDAKANRLGWIAAGGDIEKAAERSRYKLADLIAQTSGELPLLEGWDDMPAVGLEILPGNETPPSKK